MSLPDEPSARLSPEGRSDLARLSPERRAELALRLGRRRSRRDGEQTSDPSSRYEPFPLTDLQQAYWMGRTEAFALGGIASRAYVEVEAEVQEPARWERALHALVYRHDMLRAIVLEDGSQRVLPEVPEYRIPIRDLSGADAGEVREALDQVHREMMGALRDPAEWPLFDVRASRLPGGRTRFHLTHDLLALDGRSIGIFYRELAERLRDPVGGAEPAEGEREPSFRDYVLHRASREGGEDHERARRYWLERLDDLPPAPDLPLARDPASIGRPRYLRESGELDRDMSEGLRAEAARIRVSPTALFLTAYAEVLAMWSASPCFTLNLPLSIRPPLHPRIDDVLGPFTTVELLSVDHSERAAFADRARAAQGRLLEDLDHREFDGVRVQRELARSRGREFAGMPVVFTSLLGQGIGDAYGGLGRVVRSINQTAQVWMDLHVDEVDGRFRLHWDHVEGLFPEGMVADMLASCLRLLEAVARGDGDRFQAGVPLLPPRQRERRAAANATAAPIPEGLAHHPIERQARERPDHPAVVAGEVRLTFGELDRLAGELAGRILDAGVGPGELVAIAMEKGWEQVVAVLATLKAGAAYLPVDVESPPERFRFLIEDGEARVVVTQPRLAEALACPSGVRTLCVESPGRDSGGGAAGGGASDPRPAAASPSDPRPSAASPSDLAYVLYTSGSTGVPKGVMIEHRSVVNRMADVIERFGIGPDDRVMGLTALHHDLSVFDLFGGLAAGATLVLPEHRSRRDPAHWTELVASERVTVWNSVPAFMEMLVEHVEGRAGAERRPDLSSLRRVVLSGDWIPVSLPDRVRRAAPRAEVIGAGGPTETTVWDICFPVGEVDPAWRSIPYGRPMKNAVYHVRGERDEDRPDWATGELLIGGAGLARGFWRDPERTARRFVVDRATGERLYRSGDLGRWRPDGTLEFMGRKDFQLKVQGQRIEPGEIESVLLRHPAVHRAVVTAPEVPGRGRRIVAYVVTDASEAPPTDAADGPPTDAEAGSPTDAEGGSPTDAEAAPPTDEALREHLRRHLPPYMIPSAFVRLERLPLTRNGKVDRGALPSPAEPGGTDTAAPDGATSSGLISGDAAPGGPAPGGAARGGPAPGDPASDGRASRGPAPGGSASAAASPPTGAARELEAGLLRIAGEVLGVASVEPEESLLNYGANSIDIVRLGNRLERELGHRPRIDELFRLQSVRALTDWYRARSDDGPAKVISDAGPVGEIERIVQSFPVLFDPAARDAFKAREPGLRHDLDGRPGVELVGTDPRSPADDRARRRTVRTFSLKPVPFEALGRMLEALRRAEEEGGAKYGYASAGGLYPNQLYLHVKAGRVEGVEGGTYYYDPARHRLVMLEAGAVLDRSIHVPFINQPVFDEAAFSLFIVARLAAIAPGYGEHSWRFSVLEAGLMSHALELAAAEAGVGLCHIGSVEFDRIRPLFRLEESDVPVHSLLGGRPASGSSQDATEGLLDRIAELSPEEVQRLLGPEGSVGRAREGVAEAKSAAGEDRSGKPE